MRSVGAYSYNANNQPQVSGYSFDNNGAPTLYGSQALAFDPEDHLTQIGPSGSASFKAGYSGGLRAWKETGGTRTYFLYSGGVPLIEMDVNGVVQAVNSFGAAGLLSRRNGGTSGPTTFYTFDPQGNVCQRLNAAAAVTSTDVYDAFGKGYRSPSGVNDAYGFGGQWGYYHDYDTPLGLHLLSHRYLDTQTGRFLTRDPIGYAGGGNLYRFVGNSPTSFADPSGLVERSQYVAAGALAGGIGGAIAGAPGGWQTAALGAGLFGWQGGQAGGSIYDSLEDFGFAWGCYERKCASLGDVLLSGGKGAFNVTLQLLFFASLKVPAGSSGTKGGAAESPRIPTQRQARQEAFRTSGIGRNGTRVESTVELRPGSRSPGGDPGARTEWLNPNNGAVVHHDPYGNYYGPGDPQNIGPHYGVEFPGQRTIHFPYLSGHNPATNR
jgi:RHS repeat-associated protein